MIAAETKFGISRANLSIVDGVIKGPANNQTSYWELAVAVSLDRQASTAPTLKRAHAHTIVWTSARRADVAERVFGLRPYIHELTMHGLRHGRVVRSPKPYGQIAELNEAAFRASHPNITLMRIGSFIGVVANSEWDVDRAATTLANRINWTDRHEMPLTSGLHVWLKSAPHETALVLAHASIAPSVALAVWDGNHLTVTSHTQGGFNLQRDLALVFGLPESISRMCCSNWAFMTKRSRAIASFQMAQRRSRRFLPSLKQTRLAAPN